MSELGFGIIGAGAISSIHIGGIEKCEGARLVAVCDIAEDRARALGEAKGVAWYTDHKQMLAHPDLDVVCVCTPSGFRGPICVDTARAGKHIIAEKPLEVTLAKADAVIEECDRAGVKLGVIFQVRFLDDVQAVKKAVSEGRLGKPVLGDAYVKWHRAQDYYDSDSWRGTWELDGGGVLMNQAIHYVDILQWMMGPAESVFAYTDTLVKQRIEVEDTAVACLRFTSGALGVIEACTSAHSGVPSRIEIRGENGTIILENGVVTTWKVEGEEDFTPETLHHMGGHHDPKDISPTGHERQIADMVAAIRENRAPAVDGREARKSIEIITAAYTSARTGSKVTLPL